MVNVKSVDFVVSGNKNNINTFIKNVSPFLKSTNNKQIKLGKNRMRVELELGKKQSVLPSQLQSLLNVYKGLGNVVNEGLVNIDVMELGLEVNNISQFRDNMMKLSK